jgi:invasion protein IalB
MSSLALLFCSPALAQTKGDAQTAAPAAGSVTTTTTRHNGWTVVCSRSDGQEADSCSANYRVMNSKTQANLFVWLLGRNAKGEKLAEFRTLTEVLIRPGVVIRLEEGDPLRADYVSCGAAGCQATLVLDLDTVERLMAAKTVTIDMTRTDGQIIQMKMDVSGIDAALTDLGF